MPDLPADEALRNAAIAMVQNDHGVRVEDYLATLAAATGEAALATAGFDVAGHDLTPGSALFWEPVNRVLTGDVLDDVPPGSVFGIVQGAVGSTPLPTPRELFEHIAGTVLSGEWGTVAVTVGDDNKPWVLPIRQAYELRATVAELAPAVADRASLAATALGAALVQTAGAIEPAVGARLALEVTFGMAKMAPMTTAAFESTT
jgi:hypothetical protein